MAATNLSVCLRKAACCRYQWPHGLRRGTAAARSWEVRVRIPSGAWKSVSFECFFFATGSSPIQWSPTECSVIVTPLHWEGPGQLGAVAPWRRRGGDLPAVQIQNVQQTASYMYCLTYKYNSYIICWYACVCGFFRTNNLFFYPSHTLFAFLYQIILRTIHIFYINYRTKF